MRWQTAGSSSSECWPGLDENFGLHCSDLLCGGVNRPCLHDLIASRSRLWDAAAGDDGGPCCYAAAGLHPRAASALT